jgi:hypothetical protein
MTLPPMASFAMDFVTVEQADGSWECPAIEVSPLEAFKSFRRPLFYFVWRISNEIK